MKQLANNPFLPLPSSSRRRCIVIKIVVIDEMFKNVIIGTVSPLVL